MKFIILIAALLFIGLGVNAQSILKALPPYKPPVNTFSRIVGPTDSLPSLSTNKWQGVRFAGPDIMFAIPDFSAYTGLGLDYVWAVANTTTGKWDYSYTIGPRVWGGANLSTPTVKTIGAVGLRVTAFKGLLALAGMYNLTLKKSQAGIGNPAALIPGLN